MVLKSTCNWEKTAFRGVNTLITGEVVKAQLLLRILRQVKLHWDVTNLGVRILPLKIGEFF